MTGRKATPKSPLSVDHVQRIVDARAIEMPLATTQITDLLQAAYPRFASSISNYRVLYLLRYLARRGRVTSFDGGKNAVELETYGVANPRTRRLYWVVPRPQGAVMPPMSDDALYDNLPRTTDGRDAFPAGDDVDENHHDAPEGAVLELTDEGYPGWWQRQGDQWAPVERPGRKDTP